MSDKYRERLTPPDPVSDFVAAKTRLELVIGQNTGLLETLKITDRPQFDRTAIDTSRRMQETSGALALDAIRNGTQMDLNNHQMLIPIADGAATLERKVASSGDIEYVVLNCPVERLLDEDNLISHSAYETAQLARSEVADEPEAVVRQELTLAFLEGILAGMKSE